MNFTENESTLLKLRKELDSNVVSIGGAKLEAKINGVNCDEYSIFKDGDSIELSYGV
jgi:hypothetical protein